MPGAGRPEFEPIDAERKQVEALSGYGLPIDQIAVLVRDGIHIDTLRKHFANVGHVQIAGVPKRNEPDIAAAGKGTAIRVGARFLPAASVWSMNVPFASYRVSSNSQNPLGPSVKCCPTVLLASAFKSFSGLTAISR
jgi:hypothetical protein